MYFAALLSFACFHKQATRPVKHPGLLKHPIEMSHMMLATPDLNQKTFGSVNLLRESGLAMKLLFQTNLPQEKRVRK